MQFLYIFLLGASLLPLLTSCAPHAGRSLSDYAFEQEVEKIVTEIPEHEAVAVSWIYDGSTGDITALGNSWRDRLESALKNSSVTVKARKDLGLIIDDLTTYSKETSESTIWSTSGADVIVVGEYRINVQDNRIILNIKALRKNASLAATLHWSEELPRNWSKLAAQIKGNIYHKEISSITSPSADRPHLTARLNRDPACYPSGSRATIHISSEPGVHIYVLNLAADNSVSLLYPNSLMRDQPIPSGGFTFPPKAFADDLQLLIAPLRPGTTCQESFKIVASREKINFSFLPVPENELFLGARGGNMKKVLTELKKKRHWNETNLNYWTGADCE